MVRVIDGARAVVFSLCLGASAANAILVPGLYDTGVDDAGVPLASGQQDLHYELTGPAVPAYAFDPHPDYVIAPGSRWIGPGADGSGSSDDPVGEYVYTLAFDLTGIDLEEFAISGRWTSDNASSIFLNGIPTGFSSGLQPFGSLHPFTLAEGFVPGVNTLEFHVTQDPPLCCVNPSGLLVSGLAVVPEPATAWLLFLGVGVLACTSAPRRHAR